MLRNRLAVLLAERNLKITRVSKDTGISRSTLTAISQNDSKMIQMDTIDGLCQYLGVTPSDFFDYAPIKISTTITNMDLNIESDYEMTELEFEININIEKNEGRETYLAVGSLEHSVYMSPICCNINIILSFDTADNAQKFKVSVVDKLSPFLQIQLRNDMNHAIYNAIESEIEVVLDTMETTIETVAEGDYLYDVQQIVFSLTINDIF
ncbi:Cro/CI family transcriptional regulator [Listeria floridensis FSL S10-1187]|uniref:Cro/CI family transcriptional regulator n=1 Tax=Listeria floridensis FSL S10-1187 TaxID=1265817 RepID=A0ABN0RBD4_9LIST|nr:helix-turn-helix transcriptional regulator [Listeria floridensis]EUJ24363.1 Cro/CI family transcriptional regulator [Listeria floridensis FSL S10-1187]